MSVGTQFDEYPRPIQPYAFAYENEGRWWVSVVLFDSYKNLGPFKTRDEAKRVQESES